MDNVRPSRMPMLAYLLKKNPFFGRSCRKLQLKMDNQFKTRVFPRGKGTTSHQDEAQAQVISSLPRLESLSIALKYAYHFDLPPPKAVFWTKRSGYPMTLEALSHCQSIRDLKFITSTEAQMTISYIFFLGVLRILSTTLERLEISGPLVNNEPIRQDDPTTFPRLNNVTYLHIDHDNVLERLLEEHPEYFPTLRILVYNGRDHPSEKPTVSRDAIVMRPLENLILMGSVFPNRIWRIPTRNIQISSDAFGYRMALKNLCDAITADIGVFAVHRDKGCLVGSISVKASRPNWSTKFQIPWSDDRAQYYANLWPTQDTEQALLESLEYACQNRRIPLDTQISDSAPFVGYITSFVSAFVTRICEAEPLIRFQAWRV
jgi:hypothetical protein